jgi:hypothetical protein
MAMEVMNKLAGKRLLIPPRSSAGESSVPLKQKAARPEEK